MSTTLSISSRQCESVDRHDLPEPVGVLAGAETGQLRRQDVVSGSEPSTSCQISTWPLRITDGVALGAGAQRHPAGVRDLLALAVAAPAPVVERAGDLVALDRALGEVAAHVPAVAVQDVDLALACPARRRACRRTPRCRAACRRRRTRRGPGSASHARTAPAACRGRGRGRSWWWSSLASRSIWTKTRTGYSFCSGGASGHPQNSPSRRLHARRPDPGPGAPARGAARVLRRAGHPRGAGPGWPPRPASSATRRSTRT